MILANSLSNSGLEIYSTFLLETTGKELTASFGDFDVKIAGEEDIQTDNKEKVSEFFKDTLQIK